MRRPRLSRKTTIATGLVLLAVLLAGAHLFPFGPPAFRFENHGKMFDAAAVRDVSTLLAEKFPRGTPIRDVSRFLESAGATCSVLPHRHDSLYCTYEHRAAGLRGIFILVEWKILVWRENQDYLSKIEVHRGLTGP